MSPAIDTSGGAGSLAGLVCLSGKAHFPLAFRRLCRVGTGNAFSSSEDERRPMRHLTAENV